MKFKAILLALVLASTALSQTPTPAPSATPHKDNPEDCMIVATIAYHRLQQAGVWAEIVGLKAMKNGERVKGHAVCLYQASTKSPIFLYDETGSVMLPTLSRKTDDIYIALGTLLAAKTSYTLSEILVMVEDSRK